jgi:hypothetical protein
MRTNLFTALGLTLLLAAPAAGQVRIVGRVIDDVTERPLSDAVVVLRSHDGWFLSRTETGPSGTFEFEVKKRVAAVTMEVRRLSFQDNTTPVLRFDGRTFFQVEVRLDPEAILLAPLEVVAWSEVDRSPLLDNFRRRLRTGHGLYITRAQVERRNPMAVTDLLRDVPGVTVTGSGSGLRPKVRTARSAQYSALAGGCDTQIFVDGFLMNPRVPGRSGGAWQPIDFRIDEAVTPSSVEGIEIYRGLSEVPAEFLTPDARCGVIAIWTKRGGRNQQPDR